MSIGRVEIVAMAGIGVGILMIIWGVSTLVEISNRDGAEKEDPRKAAVQVCVDAGGVPILSTWDSTSLTGCIFPPEVEGGSYEPVN